MSVRGPSTGNLMGLVAVAAANLFLLRQGITLLLGRPLYLYLFVCLNMVLIQAVVCGKPLGRSHASFVILAGMCTWLCTWLCDQPQMLRGVKAVLYWYREATDYLPTYYSTGRPGFDKRVRLTLILVSFILSAIAAAVIGSHGRRRKTQLPERPLSPSSSVTAS
jgi:hypothetical protein